MKSDVDIKSIDDVDKKKYSSTVLSVWYNEAGMPILL